MGGRGQLLIQIVDNSKKSQNLPKLLILVIETVSDYSF
jgi:hypothetical protein